MTESLIAQIEPEKAYKLILQNGLKRQREQECLIRYENIEE